MDNSVKKFPEGYNFEGFDEYFYTPVPDHLFDFILARLTGAELKCLLYIIRRTSGFKRTSDTISLSQLEDGIIKKDGKRLDDGTGLSRNSIIKATRRLAKLNFIDIIPRKSTEDGSLPNEYRLYFREGSAKTALGGSAEIELGVVQKLHPQDTGIQDTGIQEIASPLPLLNSEARGEQKDPLIVQYEDCFGIMTSRDLDRLNGWEADYGKAEVAEVLQRTKAAGGQSFAYADAIFRRRKAAGLKDGEPEKPVSRKKKVKRPEQDFIPYDSEIGRAMRRAHGMEEE